MNEKVGGTWKLCQVEAGLGHLVGDMTPLLSSSSAPADSDLVARSLAGERSAFGMIVRRYQTLVCALAFSATGNVRRSEELAQDTFVAAWKQLASLREPAKLRAWLCGIARHTIRHDWRAERTSPARSAEPLSDADEVMDAEPTPATRAITADELSLMWREVGQLPETYREVLVLYYREHQSVARVAESLELSEDAVMQRLSRGRKLLHERMLGLVETALARSNPDEGFALGVQAVLPALASGSQAAGLGSAKGLAMKGGGGLTAVLLPFVGLLAALGVSWASVRAAPAGASRRYLIRWNTVLWCSIGALLLALRLTHARAEAAGWDLATVLSVNTWIWSGYVLVLTTLLVLMYRRGEAKAATVGGGDTAQVGGPPVKRGVAVLVGTYVASTAWLVGFAWMMGDGLVAAVVVGVTVVLAVWNHRQARTRRGVAAHRLAMTCHAGLCLFLLAVVNLRIEPWLATLYHVSRAAMHEALPIVTIHGVTVGVIVWAVALLAITRRGARRDGKGEEGTSPRGWNDE